MPELPICAEAIAEVRRHNNRFCRVVPANHEPVTARQFPVAFPWDFPAALAMDLQSVALKDQ
jgi:hypothetical protein